MVIKDRVRAAANRFIEIRFRDGRIKQLRTSDIKGVQTRSEGGTAIRLNNDFVVLVSCELAEVAEAMRVADGGGHAHTA